MALILVFGVLVLVAGGAATVWFVSRWRRQLKRSRLHRDDSGRLAFRWTYTALPLAVLAVSVATAAFFYPRLPDQVAYHFRLDGAPDRWLGRGAVVFWMLAAQVVLTIIAGAIPLAVIRLLSLRPPFSTTVRLDRILALMGNMMALPQAILGFTMLDIVSYNSYGVHLMPLWLFTLILISAGIIVLGWLFKSAVRGRSGPAAPYGRSEGID